MGNEFSFSVTEVNLCPLMLVYRAPDGTRGWDLIFKSQPTKEVLFSGDEPTRDEIVQWICLTSAPVWMI